MIPIQIPDLQSLQTHADVIGIVIFGAMTIDAILQIYRKDEGWRKFVQLGLGISGLIADGYFVLNGFDLLGLIK